MALTGRRESHDRSGPARCPPRPRAVLASLGGSPEPVICSLDRQRPEHVLFFVSPESARDIQTVLRGLAYQPVDHDRIVTPSAEILAEAYGAIRSQLPAKLSQWGLSWEDLTVDYTGGTKSMSAALVLATADRVHRYSYVGGVERDKGGVGIVVRGRERMWFLQNPWLELARPELERIRLHFRTGHYASAAVELGDLAARAAGRHREILTALARLAAGYREWESFEHRAALRELAQAHTFLRAYAAGLGDREWTALAARVASHLRFLERLSGKVEKDPARAVRRRGSRDRAILLDLLASADRRARIEHRYEDAVARLYSCLERAARFRLASRTPAIDNAKARPELIPEALRAELVRRHADPKDGLLRLPLFASYELLAALGDELGARFAQQEAELRSLLLLRNQSFSGHGERAVRGEEARRFRRAVVALLGVRSGELPIFPALPPVELEREP